MIFWNLEQNIEQTKPDLVLLTRTREDLDMGTAPVKVEGDALLVSKKPMPTM